MKKYKLKVILLFVLVLGVITPALAFSIAYFSARAVTKDNAGQNIRGLDMNALPGNSVNISAKQNVEVKKELSFTATEESTVYDLMQKLKAEGKINFTEKSYAGMGKLVDSIGGIRSDGKMTWIYYVNGRQAEIGISKYIIKPGDVVSWKYEKLLAY